MKKFVALLGLFALTAAVPAIAAESTTPPTSPELAISSPACSAAPTSQVLNAQPSEVPSWLTADPLLWQEIQRAGCGSYCINNCDGCCASLGGGICACC